MLMNNEKKAFEMELGGEVQIKLNERDRALLLASHNLNVN
jgi:hypothetical protein